MKGPCQTALVVIALLVVASFPRRAMADLRSEASAIRASLQADGASVTSLGPIFLETDQTRTFAPIAASNASGEDVCATVILMGARTTLFSVVTAEDTEQVDETLARATADKDGKQTASVEGFYATQACNGDIAHLERLVVRMRSPRGGLEVLVARSPRPLAALDAASLSRAEGTIAPRGDPGAPLVPAPTKDRRKGAVSRARLDGAASVAELDMAAGKTGNGEFVLKISPGCHRFDLVADASPNQGVDLDAELRDNESGAVLALDRGETPDARVEGCLAKPSEVSVRFVGAPPGARVFISDALFKLPEWVPDHWGARTTSTLVNMVRRRSVPSPRSRPLSEALGVQGSTTIPIEVEPDRCYLAAVALIRGTSHGVRLVSLASARASTEESPPSNDGASTVFCSEDRDVARLTVDVPGSAVWWVLEVWPLGIGSP